MELTLITKNKTYKTDTFDLTLKSTEDLLDVIGIDTLDLTDKRELTMRILRCSKQIRPILRDVFNAADEDLDTAKVSSIKDVFVDVIKETIGTLNTLPAALGDEKNV